jgi:MBG domain (YGX type)/FG-GAP repeat
MNTICRPRIYLTAISCIALLGFQTLFVGTAGARPVRSSASLHGATAAGGGGHFVYQTELNLGAKSQGTTQRSPGLGLVVALSADGHTALLGAPYWAVDGKQYAGVAEVFRFSNGAWSAPTELSLGSKARGGAPGGGDNFGLWVALSGDGNTAIVGVPNRHVNGQTDGEGAAEVFRFSGGRWSAPTELSLGSSAVGSGPGGVPSGDGFGSSLALSTDGNTALIGAPGRAVNGQPGAGAIYVFRFNGGKWSAPAELSLGARAVGRGPRGTGGDAFGSSVALSSDGNTALAGAPGRYSTFDQYGNVLTEPGAVEVFQLNGGTWSAPTELTVPIGERLGSVVALTDDGKTAVALAWHHLGWDTGFEAAELFNFIGGSWSAPQELDLGDNPNGWPAALSGDGRTALDSEWFRDLNGQIKAGGAQEFRLSGGSWSGPTGISLDKAARLDYFGSSLALSDNGSVALVGAPGREVNGTKSAGAAEVFVDDPTAVAVTLNASSVYLSPLHISGLSPSDPAIGYNPAGQASNVTGLLSCMTNATSSSPVGWKPFPDWPGQPYDVMSCSGLSDPGHRVVYDYVNSNYIISPFTPVLAWTHPAAMTYGTALSSKQLDATAVDGQGHAIAGSFAYDPAKRRFLHAGLAQPLDATFTPKDATDYISGGTVSTTIDVNPANLLITANDRSVAQRFPLPALTWHAKFVARDKASSLTTQPVCLTSATTNAKGRVTSPLGTYPITCSGAVHPDYVITYGPGTLTVQAPLEVTGSGHQSKQTVTYTWTVVSGPQPHGFNVLGVSHHGKVIRMNARVIKAHAGADYTFVAHNVKVDIVSFYVNVKTSAGFMKFGRFTVTG